MIGRKRYHTFSRKDSFIRILSQLLMDHPFGPGSHSSIALWRLSRPLTSGYSHLAAAMGDYCYEQGPVFLSRDAFTAPFPALLLPVLIKGVKPSYMSRLPYQIPLFPFTQSTKNKTFLKKSFWSIIIYVFQGAITKLFEPEPNQG
jgi:hypothetical protein